MKIQTVTFSDIMNDQNHGLSADYWDNRKQGKLSYVNEDGLYVEPRMSQMGNPKIKYFTPEKVAQINSLLKRKIFINDAIEQLENN